MNTSIVWFKTDLRLSDNETLFRAIEQSDIILPVYCFEDEHYKTCEFGFARTGNFRAHKQLFYIDKEHSQRKTFWIRNIFKMPQVKFPKELKSI